jgi:hypothetical protein
MCRTWHRFSIGTRMLYDDRHVFINGESFIASGVTRS